MHSHRADVIKDVKSMLEYYQALGFDSLPLSLKALPVANSGTALSRNDRSAEFKRRDRRLPSVQTF